jgi:glycosyltransferase involved in cell wall biosynthesis
MNESPLPGPPLRIAVLGDFEGPHTRRWVEPFIARGHEVHAVSFYRPGRELSGATVHVLRDKGNRAIGQSGKSESKATSLRRIVPPSLERLVQAWRYRRAGLREVISRIEPDVFHAHYVVEHGFYGAFAGRHPYVVSAWGSDLYVAPGTPFGRWIAGWTLRRADLVAAHDPELARRAVVLGAREDAVKIIHLGVDDLFLEPTASVNLTGAEGPPTVISDRALEPLYNVDTVIRAFAGLHLQLSEARLLVAGDGSQRDALGRLVAELGVAQNVTFLGHLTPAALRDALATAHVYVSAPSTDSLALSTVEAMAVGAFPVVSDLPSQSGWLTDGQNALLVPARDTGALTTALRRAFEDGPLRRDAAAANRAHVETAGRRGPNIELLERYYYELAGHPIAGPAAI